MACDMGISDRSVRRIAKMELGPKPYKLRKVQLLTAKKQCLTAPEMPKTFETDRKPKSISEMQIGGFNKTLHQLTRPKRHEGCKASFPDISSEEWPPYTPDLSLMDYSVRSILESRACTKLRTL
ncbi:hypothetical protein TNCV_4406551 [Trichonephila clavipes]|nr:hypothetical protein TNCV_4406551 [Trichonephila clavipes]